MKSAHRRKPASLSKPPLDPKSQKARRQVAALPWRMGAYGVEVLLITSRDTGRWVTPKGGRMRGRSDAQAAAQEALEEAGVEGCITETPMGEFRYLKRFPSGAAQPCVVALYLLEVHRELADWQERAERTRRWMAATDAACMVEEADLGALIRSLALSGASQRS